MNTRQVLQDLKSLIEEYEDLSSDLHSMIDSWEKYEDPSCDPGFQHEKECQVDSTYAKIESLISTFFK